MPQTHDVLINGAGYMLVPGSYRYSQQSSEPKAFRTGAGNFAAALADEDAARWIAKKMLPLRPGLGHEPGRLVLAPGESMADVSATVGANFDTNSKVCVFNGVVYFSQGANLYKVVMSGNNWSGVALIGAAGGTITGMAVVGDLLVMATTAAGTMSSYSGSGAIANTPAANAGMVWGYAQGLWRSKKNAVTGQYSIISGSIDGGATWTDWQLDSPVRSVCVWRGRATGGGVVLIGTQYMLWELAGQWTGSPAAFSGTVSPVYDGRSGAGTFEDFNCLVEYQGDMYCWYAGTLHRWDGSRLVPVPGAPRGYSNLGGGTVAGGYLVWEVHDVQAAVYRLHVWDGARWAVLADGGNTYNAAAGTGGIIADGVLITLNFAARTISRWALPVYTLTTAPASSGNVVVGPLDAGQGDAVKVWTEVIADWSLVNDALVGTAPPNPGGNVLIEYSADDGATWTTAGTTAIAAAAKSGQIVQGLNSGVGIEAARLLARLTWTPTSSYAAWQLCGVWANGYLVADKPRLEAWEMDIHISDKLIIRDGSVDPRTGETMLQALRTLAQNRAVVAFRDIDYDLTSRQVNGRITALSEKARKGDGVHFTETVMHVVIAAVN